MATSVRRKINGTKLNYWNNFTSGAAVVNNLLSKGFTVELILDLDARKCEKFPCKIAKTPSELAEKCDITITGKSS